MDKTPSETLSEMEANMTRAKAFVEKMKWIEAKTYANTAPHEYALLKNCPHELISEWDWFCSYISKHGYPEKFYSKTFIYANVEANKYWHYGNANLQAILINRAKTERKYR